MDEHHWTVTYWKCLMLAYCPETETMSKCMEQHLCTNMFVPKCFQKCIILKSSFWVFLFFLKWQHAVPQSAPSPSERDKAVKWELDTRSCYATSPGWLHDSCGVIAFLSFTDATGGKHKTWSVCCIYMCSGWFCKQLMNSETGWPW